MPAKTSLLMKKIQTNKPANLTPTCNPDLPRPGQSQGIINGFNHNGIGCSCSDICYFDSRCPCIWMAQYKCYVVAGRPEWDRPEREVPYDAAASTIGLFLSTLLPHPAASLRYCPFLTQIHLGYSRARTALHLSHWKAECFQPKRKRDFIVSYSALDSVICKEC